MGDWIRHHAGRRPWWMNLLMLFCAYMAFVYVPWDLFVKPVAVDEEVWFGVVFHDAWAKVLAVPHWAVYAAGLAGFWSMRSWMWPWAAVYAGQVAFGMFLWPILYRGGLLGLLGGLVAGAVFLIPTVALWRARERFQEDPRPRLRERYGEWALVTGASAGIGTAFARRLAREGLSCVLVARREERLRGLAEELEKQHGVSTRVVGADLATEEGWRAVLEAVRDLEIAVLVNNAGVGYAGRLDGQEQDRLVDMVRLNCEAPVALTAELLPKMRGRGRGAVVMVGSVAGCQPLPLHALYGATKAFDNHLGEALWAELREHGVDVVALLPGPTDTEFFAQAGETRETGQPPEEVVDTALRSLGHKPQAIAGAFNWLRANVAYRLLPRSVLALVAKQVIAQQTPPERQ
ncbi:MAG: SDR family oxidoreductase [Myxococcota bacterium]|nr:SDR family oxidoreductase [Myxococcota bacterium]